MVRWSPGGGARVPHDDLESIDDTVFMAMNDVGFGVQGVLDGIAAAAEAGLTPIKINMVVQRGVNDGSILDMARHIKGSSHTLRFIEYMDVGITNGWRLDDVVPAREIVEMLDREFGIEPVDPSYRGEVAQRWRYRDGTGEVGVITSVTQPFCGDCTRARLSAEGVVYTCLFATRGTDLRQVLRSGATNEILDEVVSGLWMQSMGVFFGHFSRTHCGRNLSIPVFRMFRGRADRRNTVCTVPVIRAAMSSRSHAHRAVEFPESRHSIVRLSPAVSSEAILR